MITITVPLEPIGFNNAYNSAKNGRRFLSKQAKQYKEAVRLATRGKELDVDREKHYLSVEAHLYFPNMLTKDGLIKLRRFDLDGHLKFLIDSACEALGFDDSLILDLVAHKRPGKSQSIVMLRRHDLHTLDKS